MTVSILCPMSFTTWFDPYNPGAPVQANLYYYHTGTEDLITVYNDANLAVPHAQPVATMGSGRVPPVWIGALPEAGYRVRVFDQYSTLLEDVQGLPGSAVITEGGGGEEDPSDPTRLMSTGDVIWSFSNNQPREGFVICNGDSIGSALSAATQRANDDVHALFIHLWQQDVAGTILTIGPTGRGASADSDWAANKHIATIDLQGRGVIGVDAMGTTAKNRMAGVTFSLGNQALLGSIAGAALHTLDLTQVPNHAHTVTDPGHQHYGVTPDHLHYNYVYLGADSAHQHYVEGWTGSENANHTHYTTGGSAALQGFGDTGGRVAAYQGVQTGSQSTSHQHYFANWSRAGDGAHYHTAYHSPAAADRSLAFWVDLRLTGLTVAPTTGGGAAHNNVQPSMTLCAYMRL